MRKFFDRAAATISGESGMGTLEYAIIIFIVLLIAVVFFKFRDAVVALFNSATGKVTSMHNAMSDQFKDMEYGVSTGATGVVTPPSGS